MKNLPAHAQAFMQMYGLKYPVIQAGMDGAATPPLVTAVSNAGGMGTLPLGFRAPALASEQIQAVQSGTGNSYLVNFVLNFPTLSFPTAIQAGVKNFLFSWGLPDDYLVQQIRDHHCKMGIQVSGKLGAIEALKLSPDFLVVQGVNAGGHVQGNKPLDVALTEVLQVANDVPVVAAGGITTGKDIHRYLYAGASAVVMGTRFVATRESAAHSEYKSALVKTQSGADSVLTVCLNKVWPNATHRILRSNTTFQLWESNGRPPGPLSVEGGTLVGNRPGEHDIVAVDADGNTTWERYVDVVPVEDMKYCDVHALGTFAGEGVGAIQSIPGVEELMQSLSIEYDQCS